MNYHQLMVNKLVKKPELIMDHMDKYDAGLIHMTMGISGEAGELLDAVKKCVMYDQQLDIENVIEELGDIEFYLEGMRQLMGLRREDILQANYNKLMVRYEHGYSDEAAKARADKGDDV